MRKHRKRIDRRATILLWAICILFLSVVAIKTVKLSAGPKSDQDCRRIEQTSTKTLSPDKQIIGNRTAFPRFIQVGGTIDDVSCLNRTPVSSVISVESEEDIQAAIAYARERKLHVSIAGVRHSMGGQAFFQNAVILDMRKFRSMHLNSTTKILTVQSGAIWLDIQEFLNQRGFSPKAMQSNANFTIGGSISVNGHGMDHRIGALSSTIKSIRIITSDGFVQTLSRSEQPELFRAVIGGYGLFGVILDAEIDVTENVWYRKKRELVNYKEIPQLFETALQNPNRYGLLYVHLSPSPKTLLDDGIAFLYESISHPLEEVTTLEPERQVKLRRFFLNVAKTGKTGTALRWWAEKHLDPLFEACSTISRNDAITEGESCLTSRNQAMYIQGEYLQNSLPKQTDILQEYFVPRSAFISYIDGLRTVLSANTIPVLNIAVRAVRKEDILLNYAPEEMLAIVMYFNQKINQKDLFAMKQLTRDLTDLAIRFNGKPYLPYQLVYTDEQIHSAYSNIDSFFILKKQHDPNLLFMNALYDRYAVK